jgi:hypothetical protein
MHMAFCPACEALEGKPADVDPHDNLRGVDHNLCRDGVVEIYRCGCGAKFERFVANKAFGARSGSWKTLKQPGR